MENPKARMDLESLFKKLDKDGDGKVSYKEWMRGLTQNEAETRDSLASNSSQSSGIQGPRKDESILSKYFGGADVADVGVLFRCLDQDKNGSLSWEELEAGTKALAALSAARGKDIQADELNLLGGGTRGCISQARAGVLVPAGQGRNYSIVKEPNARVGRVLPGSGKRQWVSIEDALFGADALGLDVGKGCKYVTKGGFHVNYHAEYVDEIIDGGEHCWRMVCEDNTASLRLPEVPADA